MTPYRAPLRDMKLLRKNRIFDGDIEEMAYMSPRVLIQVMYIFPENLILEVSPDSSILRKTVRLPLIMILLCAGVVQGYLNVVFKCTGELIAG